MFELVVILTIATIIFFGFIGGLTVPFIVEKREKYKEYLHYKREYEKKLSGSENCKREKNEKVISTEDCKQEYDVKLNSTEDCKMEADVPMNSYYDDDEDLNNFFMQKNVSNALREKYNLLAAGFKNIYKFDVDVEKEFIGWWLPGSRVTYSKRGPRKGRFLKIFFNENSIRVQMRKPRDRYLLDMANTTGGRIDASEIPSESKLNYRLVFSDVNVFEQVYAYFKDSYLQEMNV